MLAGAALLLAATPAANAAQNLYWDANGTTGTGGSGTWNNLGNAYWTISPSGGGTLQQWDNDLADADTAYFNGTAGTVTVDSGIVAQALRFYSAGYKLQGGSITIPYAANLGATIIQNHVESGAVEIATNITLSLTGTNSGNTPYHVRNYTNDTLTLSGNFTISSASGTGAKWLSLNQIGANGTILFSGSLNYDTNSRVGLYFGYETNTSDTATYIVSGSNTITESSSIARGTVLVRNNNAFGTAIIRLGANDTLSTQSVKLLTDGAYTVSQTVYLDRGANTTRVLGGNTADVSTFSGTLSFENTSKSVQITAATGGQVNITGLINDGTGTSTVEKIGNGVVRLARAAGNTYDGATTVTAGTLILANTSNSATGTGQVSVSGTGTLGGGGYASGLTTAVASTSAFAPGEVGAIGVLHLNGGLSAASGATFNFQLNGSSIDQISFGTGNLTLGGEVNFNFTSLGTVLTETTYSLFLGGTTWTEGVGLDFNFVGPTGYALNSAYGGGNGYIWDAAGKSLTVQFSAIPEPTVSLLMGLGLATVLWSRRRRA